MMEDLQESEKKGQSDNNDNLEVWREMYIKIFHMNRLHIRNWLTSTRMKSYSKRIMDLMGKFKDGDTIGKIEVLQATSF